GSYGHDNSPLGGGASSQLCRRDLNDLCDDNPNGLLLSSRSATLPGVFYRHRWTDAVSPLCARPRIGAVAALLSRLVYPSVCAWSTLRPDRHHLAARRGASGEVRAPCDHQLAPLLEQVAAIIGLLCFVAHGVCQGFLDHFALEVSALARPRAECISETMHRHIVAHGLQRFEHCRIGHRLAGLHTRKDEVIGIARSAQNRERAITERHAMLHTRFHSAGRDCPSLSGEIDFRPLRAD